MGRFADRHVIVTGGAGALGHPVVEALLEEGAVCSVPCEEPTLPLALDGLSGVTPALNVDLTVEADVVKFFNEAAERSPIWASIHIAGGFDMSPLTETSAEQFEGQMRKNALTCFLCCREAARHMKVESPTGRYGRGRIVNVAARPAVDPAAGAGMVAYTASKAAVAAMTQAIAQEVLVDEIWVNAVLPSIMDTAANRAAMPTANHNAWVGVDEVAATILFLASPENKSTRSGLVPVYGRS